MLDSRIGRDPLRAAPPIGAVEAPDLIEWLRAGRLTLVDQRREAISVEEWSNLPAGVRAKAIADFHRVISPGAKAAVLFLDA